MNFIMDAKAKTVQKPNGINRNPPAVKNANRNVSVKHVAEYAREYRPMKARTE